MKNFLIITSIIVLAVIAAYDTRDILNEIAAITPSQVELKENIQNSTGQGIEKRFDIKSRELQPQPQQKQPQNFETPQNTSKEISPRLNPIEKRFDKSNY